METIRFNDFITRMGGEARIDKIYVGKEEVYVGKKEGCGGIYHEPGTIGFKRALGRVRKENPLVVLFTVGLAPSHPDDTELYREFERDSGHRAFLEPGTCFGVVTAGGRTWVDWVSGWNRTITVYVKGPAAGHLERASSMFMLGK